MQRERSAENKAQSRERDMEEGKPEEGSGRTNDTLQSAKEVEE